MKDLEVIILAAGQGTRMKSDRPKVLHELGDKPLLSHEITTAQQLQSSTIHAVYGQAHARPRERDRGGQRGVLAGVEPRIPA